jgi:hypothetical protein
MLFKIVIHGFILTLILLAPVASLSASAADGDTATLSAPDVDLTPEEQAEREGRRACKAALCAAFHNKANGQNVACPVTKSFRKVQLQKIVSKAKVSWPWGRVVCKTDLKADRAVLSQALTADTQAITFETHAVACQVEHETGAASNITVELTPEVMFEKGKAVKAVLHWGKVDGPTLVKGLMWTATATDNTVNVLGSMVVDDLNDFVTNKCDEVKADWVGK